METFDFFPYALPIRNQTGSFQCIQEFSENQDHEYYDALFEQFNPSFNCSGLIIRDAPAKGVIQFVFDFHPSRFTRMQSGFIKLFLYSDKKALGKMEYAAGSQIPDEKIEGNWFLHDHYLYLELICRDQNQNSYKLWGWTDCLDNQNTIN